ncbi:MAG TPA: 2Fe-2S iron-sulfur cluster-binding protein [Actinomycetota bacterium]|jgi:succinate dehydrogenase/fumarate reductase iron-sulfur protein|nr:2Fe-2S iron-sulfur cluster-binding protein [Actinomycetota bacterium]
MTAADAGGRRTYRVYRYKRGEPGWRFDMFDVPLTRTVLEGLRWIQLHIDRTLAIRHSCMHASCGTCGVQVNGREALACVTPVDDLGATITVEPLANIPVLTDLVVDMREFVARFPDEIPSLRAAEQLPEATPLEGIDAYDRFEDCIECGLCLSACPVSATSDAYVGPAALAAAQRLLEEPRGADTDRVLEWADAPFAGWRCHAAFECTAACPSDVRPAERIMALRGRLGGRGATS